MNKFVIIVLVVTLIAGLSGVYVLFYLPNSFSPMITPSPTYRATPTPIVTNTPTPIVTNTPTPILTAPTPFAASGPTIKIYYTAQNPEKIYYTEKYYDTPSPGYVYLMVNMTIENNGYDECDTSPAWFSVVTGNYGSYNVDIMLTSYVGNWSTVDIPNGYTFSGALVFQIPSSASVPSIEYNYPIGSSGWANVQWINVG